MWDKRPSSDLQISLIQSNLFWNQPDKNLNVFSGLIEPLQNKTDLVLLPEMFTSGFSLEPETIDPKESYKTTELWMLSEARKTNAAICGSVLYVGAENHRTNRMLFATPEGDLWHYDKTHLFRMGGEHERYEAGKERKVFRYRGWRILATICYDLRFPVFLRNLGDYDLMLCPANWPAARRTPWRTLLQARAIENLAYVAGVNRIGTDGNDLVYSGDSMLVSYNGEHLIDESPDQAFVKTTTLSAERLASFRRKFPAWQDADRFNLIGYQ